MSLSRPGVPVPKSLDYAARLGARKDVRTWECAAGAPVTVPESGFRGPLSSVPGVCLSRRSPEGSASPSPGLSRSVSAVTRKLTKVLRNYVDGAEKPGVSEQLYKAMKALEYIFKFIVRSRVLFNQ